MVLGIQVRDIEIETCRTHREKESEMMREILEVGERKLENWRQKYREKMRV